MEKQQALDKVNHLSRQLDGKQHLMDELAGTKRVLSQEMERMRVEKKIAEDRIQQLHSTQPGSTYSAWDIGGLLERTPEKKVAIGRSSLEKVASAERRRASVGAVPGGGRFNAKNLDKLVQASEDLRKKLQMDGHSII